MEQDLAPNEVIATFEIEGLDTDDPKRVLHVLGFRGQEAISRLFSFELDLACADSKLDLLALLGKTATLAIRGPVATRKVVGIVSAIGRRQVGRGMSVYGATLVPLTWPLTRNSGCRVFQHTASPGKYYTTEEIVASVLEDWAIFHLSNTDKDDKLSPRRFCVQYCESDWDFISRLLEQDGIFYYFAADGDLVLGDRYQNHTNLIGAEEDEAMPFIEPSAVPDREHVSRLDFRSEVCPDLVTLRDYNYRLPRLKMEGACKAGSSAKLEVFDYPGTFREPEAGKQRAGVQLQQARWGQLVGTGTSDCSRFSAGFYFKLTGYNNPPVGDNSYLLVEVHHRAEGQKQLETASLTGRLSYSNTFRCIPLKVPFRPPRITPRPRIQGVQTAVVVGPKEEEIYTDKLGRVMVKFHWDREERNNLTSSCWIRVAQPWAGAGWGALWIPRVGHEVVVSFEEGDPDRPLVTGSVYHEQHVPPWKLPDHKTRSGLVTRSSPRGKGKNELRFEDKKGGEEIYLHAQRNLREHVGYQMSTTVTDDQRIAVKGNRTIFVGNDDERTGDEYINVSGNRIAVIHGKEDSVDVYDGDQVHTVAKDATLKVGSKRSVQIGDLDADDGRDDRKVFGNRDLYVSKNDDTNIRGNKYELVDGSCSVEIKKGPFKLTCGESQLVLNADGTIEIRGAAGSIKLKSSGLSVFSTGTVTINGTVVDINEK